jgi:SAM-dependent methyltransferase
MFRRKITAVPASPDIVDRSILEQYVTEPPSDQLAIDVFAGEWSSRFPDRLGVNAGGVPLFEDPRIAWVIEQMGGVDSLDVLELGPLEGGHSSMLNAAGANVTAIESNTRAFLKCLITKNLLDLRNCRFELGDFLPFLQHTDRRFDLVLASGVLYHSPDPVALVEAMARVTDRIAIWTHVFDDELLDAPQFERVFAPTRETVEWRGRTIGLRRRAYLETLDWTGFCGGSADTALWIERQGLFDLLNELGFADVRVQSDDREHPHGPCLMLLASRA